MIYSCLQGRIGNIMFEVVAAASHAKKMEVPYLALFSRPDSLPEWDNWYIEYLEQFKETILRNIPLSGEYPENIYRFEERKMTYKALASVKDMILDGYFQSEKYFDKELVRELFAIDLITYEYIKTKYGKILDQHPVSVVVRRGDYLVLSAQYVICKMPYYRKAMAYLGKDKMFLVISDDIEWCKSHFKGYNVFFVEDESPTVDLYLASLCTHHIISNTTFAWWGAWLNPNPNKIVVYPSIWMGPLNYKEKNVSDLCPPEWIPIRVVNRCSEFLIKYGATSLWRIFFSVKYRLRRLFNIMV